MEKVFKIQYNEDSQLWQIEFNNYSRFNKS